MPFEWHEDSWAPWKYMLHQVITTSWTFKRLLRTPLNFFNPPTHSHWRVLRAYFIKRGKNKLSSFISWRYKNSKNNRRSFWKAVWAKLYKGCMVGMYECEREIPFFSSRPPFLLDSLVRCVIWIGVSWWKALGMVNNIIQKGTPFVRTETPILGVERFVNNNVLF